MDFQRIRLFLLIGMGLVATLLYATWQQEHAPKKERGVLFDEAQALPEETLDNSVPQVSFEEDNRGQVPVQGDGPLNPLENSDLVWVSTDVFKVAIDLNGGDIVQAQLLKYPKSLNDPQPTVLLDKSATRNYVAQSGLISTQGPDSKTLGRAQYQTTQSRYVLEEGHDHLEVKLLWSDSRDIQVEKVYRFYKDNYLVDVEFVVNNQSDKMFNGKFYGQLRRQPLSQQGSGILAMQMYQGTALYTPDKPYKKLKFDKMKESPFSETIKGGWAAQVEHYFLSAWVPDKDANHRYYTKVDSKENYYIGAITPMKVAPGQSSTMAAQLYIGPEKMETLKAIAPGLELTIDYGILWPISQLLFWLLKLLFQWIGNWGWAIIGVTFLIKLVFYKLSAASYRSMGQMRKLQPRIQSLKERFGDDKQKFSQAMMEMYKKEKINPLGGCLPIIVQIPVFIALYYVLLESVELRQAPFMFWIQDLSTKDPYYVLPLLMGVTMFLQQKLNPSPPDPLQAKIMMMMPVIFTFLFMQFPSGLVLYWVANNVLSIIQQWTIMKNLDKEGLGHKKVKAT